METERRRCPPRKIESCLTDPAARLFSWEPGSAPGAASEYSKMTDTDANDRFAIRREIVL